ncbi:hypothetical protein [Fischerella sp. PCC 9605]|nr:hypothetical protein [Fischerella sp. PCC 9605]
MNDLEIIEAIKQLIQLNIDELEAFISVCENEKLKSAIAFCWMIIAPFSH